MLVYQRVVDFSNVQLEASAFDMAMPFAVEHGDFLVGLSQIWKMGTGTGWNCWVFTYFGGWCCRSWRMFGQYGCCKILTQLVDGWETSTSLAHSLKSGKNARVSLDDILIWHNILGCTMNREEEKGQFLRISSFAVQEDHNPCIDHGRSCSCSTEQIPTPSATTRWSENSRENTKIHWFLLIGLTQIVIVVRSSYPAKFRFHHPNCYIDLF